MSVGTADLTSVGNALKKLYPIDEAKAALYEAVPLYGMIEKKDVFEGDGTYNITVQSSGQYGIGTTMQGAIQNRTSNDYSRFAVTRARMYGVGRISREAIKAGRSNKGSVIRTLDREQKALMKSMKRILSNLLWGGGGGALGQLGIGSINGNAFTLVDKRQVVWFERNMPLILSPTSGTVISPARAGQLVVSAVDRQNGIITCTQPITTGVPGAVDSDFVFLYSVYGGDASNAVITGVAGWVPDANPNNTLFYGVDRSVDPTRLGGLRYNINRAPIEEGLQAALGVAAIEGQAPSTGFMNPYDYTRLTTSIGSQRMLSQVASKTSPDMPSIGYKGVKIIAPNDGGECEFYPDHGVPAGHAYLLDLSSWELATLGDMLEYVDDDGVVILRSPNSDEFEWRIGAYGNLACDNPGANMVVTGL